VLGPTGVTIGVLATAPVNYVGSPTHAVTCVTATAIPIAPLLR